jgi:acetyl-CoA synthetase
MRMELAVEDQATLEHTVYSSGSYVAFSYERRHEAAKLLYQSRHDPEGFWAGQARERISWYHPFLETSDVDFNMGSISWFLGGKLNVCVNCVDRHLPTRGDKVALLWEGDEPGETRRITYRELYHEVCRLANSLKSRGVRKGDRVAIYMPMIPEAVYAMLACARIGAIHSVVFAGFSADSLSDRIRDAACKVLITADEGLRGKKRIPLKLMADEALLRCPEVEHVLVAKRTGASVPMKDGRDEWLTVAMDAERPHCPAEVMDSEDPLFLLYTSGSTGKPKGLLHTSAGYLTHAMVSHHFVFDLQEEDVYACMADIGWITGHSYVVYGPLANGATTVLFESIPTYPNAGRYWEMVERLRITQLYTAPTAIRAVMREGDEWVRKYDRSSLRVLGSVGEPINPEAWRWYHDVVGEGRCPIVDTWWQTETGGILISPIPGVTDLKAGSATVPLFGIEPVVLDEHGKETLQTHNVSGVLALKRSWPGQARSIWGDHKRFVETYFAPYPGYYFTGDGCRRDELGYWWITGRVDDVLNVSGHRLGTAEVESALVAHRACAEAAVVGASHEIKGQAVFAYVVLKEGYEANPELIGELRSEARHRIGAIASPDWILVVPGLPKTRSGKIMRRILRKIAEQDVSNLGDISTLADPGIVDLIVTLRQGI